MDTADIKLLLDLGIYHHLRGELAEALVYYGGVVDEDPDNAVANYNINSVFQEQEYWSDKARSGN